MKKRGLVFLIIFSIVLIGGFVGRFILWKPDPNELLTHGLEQLNQATSFRYTLTQHQWVDGKDRVLTEISGEKEGENTRISGNFVGTDVQMIVAGEGFFIQDPFTKRWIRFSDVPAAQEAFLAELDPKSSLQFEELGEVMLNGQQKLNDKKTWVIEFKPTVQNEIMKQNWSDFSYVAYIGKRDKQIHKVVIEAKNKNNNQEMSISLGFKDYGEKLDIKAPNL